MIPEPCTHCGSANVVHPTGFGAAFQRCAECGLERPVQRHKYDRVRSTRKHLVGDGSASAECRHCGLSPGTDEWNDAHDVSLPLLR